MYVEKVVAEICDIRSVDPDPQAEFLVDTNAWYWTTYTRASIPTIGQPRMYQSQHYPRFIKRALDKGSVLHRCDLSLAELSHTIEDCERRIFIEFIANREVPVKEYRHCENEERKEVVSEIESAWGQIVQMSHCLGLSIEESTTTGALNDLKASPVDGYDVLLLQAMRQAKVTRILTDDSDFATVPGLEVFTGNPELIELARAQGKLRDA